jgi:PilZ domain
MPLFSAKNRRRAQRQWIAVPVSLHAEGARSEGVTINVSGSGMYLFTAANVPVGAEIELSFLPPGTKKIVKVAGVVRRKALYLYGIEFSTGEPLGASQQADAFAGNASS